MSRISVPLDRATRRKLRGLADEQKRSVGAQAALLIESALDSNVGASPHDKANEPAGACESTGTNLEGAR
jgi:hypothetical protein